MENTFLETLYAYSPLIALERVNNHSSNFFLVREEHQAPSSKFCSLSYSASPITTLHHNSENKAGSLKQLWDLFLGSE